MSTSNDAALNAAADSAMTGHVYDGIQEYDNPLPDWYIGLFIVTIVWAVIYTVQWHVLDSKSQAAMYQQELADARVQWPDLDKKVAELTKGILPADKRIEDLKVVVLGAGAARQSGGVRFDDIPPPPNPANQSGGTQPER